MCVVDGALKEGAEFLMIEELAAIIGDDGMDAFEGVFPDEFAELTMVFGLGDGVEFAHDIEVCFAFY